MGEPVDPQSVTLREVSNENLGRVLRLGVLPEQEKFVASNAISIAQAHYSDKAWFRAIYAGDEPAGFLMLEIDQDPPEYYLWRFMIDHGQQRRGIGRQAVELLVEHVRGLPGATCLLTSTVPGEGSPMGFYERCGFVRTGEVEEGEDMLRRAL